MISRYNPRREKRKYYSPKRDGRRKEAIIILEDETENEVKDVPKPNECKNVQSETT